MSEVPQITLNDGVQIPQLGLGVLQISREDTAAVVELALEIGYRHFDTAEMYNNEAGVGSAVQASTVPREEIFITSKLSNAAHRPDDARHAFDETLSQLGMHYVDLFLIHWPLPTLYDGDFVSTWKTLIEFQRDGRARSIGVSNFQVPHLEQLARESDVVPSVNQIEVHPYFGNEVVRGYGAIHGIVTEAWSPIARGRVVDDAELQAIGKEIGCSPAQVALRWHVQRGDVVFPKSSNEARLKENFVIYEFDLSEEQMARISSIDEGEAGRSGPHPDTFARIPEPPK